MNQTNETDELESLKRKNTFLRGKLDGRILRISMVKSLQKLR